MYKVLIVGAGIAGLGAAITIAENGNDVTVVERSTRLADGAGITMMYRGPDALAAAGVLEACVAEGTVGYGVSIFKNMYDSAGNPRTLPQAVVRDDDLPSYIIMYRPVLARILSDKATEHGAVIRRGVGVTNIDDRGETVIATFSDGTTDNFDLVVGADGAASEVRKYIDDKVCPEYSGNMSLRWVKKDAPKGPAGFYVSDEAVPVVIHRLHGDMVYIATGIDMENRRVDDNEARDLFRKVLDGFEAPYVRELLSLVDDEDAVIARPYLLHHQPAPWFRGRIVVVGDAAHTIAANMGAGGVIGFEDGVVLGQELARKESLEAALTAFQDRRVERTGAVVRASREMLEAQVQRQASALEINQIRTPAIAALMEPF